MKTLLVLLADWLDDIIKQQSLPELLLLFKQLDCTKKWGQLSAISPPSKIGPYKKQADDINRLPLTAGPMHRQCNWTFLPQSIPRVF